MPEPKLTLLSSEWLTLEEAMRALGKSRKTIERLVASQELKSQLEERQGRKSERVYSAEDVERLKRQPATQALAPRQQVQLALPELGKEIGSAIRELADQPERVGITLKLWLSLEEATLYSGLAKRDVLKLARDGRIVARKSGGWKILRKSLEAFEG